MDYETAGKVAALVMDATTTAIDCGPMRHDYYAIALRVCRDGSDPTSYMVELPVPSPRSLLLFEDNAVLSGDCFTRREVPALAGVA